MWPFKSKNWDKLGTEYSRDTLKRILSNGTGTEDIRLNDNKYRALPYNDFAKLAWGGYSGDNGEFEDEQKDCDDFALFYESDTRKQWAKKSKSKCALAFGRAKVLRGNGSQPHMMIWQVDDSGNINWIEGQNYQKVSAPAKIYYLEG